MSFICRIKASYMFIHLFMVSLAVSIISIDESWHNAVQLLALNNTQILAGIDEYFSRRKGW